MNGSGVQKLQLFDPAAELAPAEVERLLLREILRPGISRKKITHEPFSADWFAQIENLRYARHGAWLPKLLGFAKHAGDSLLGLGDGLGTDWLQYARGGPDVTACCPGPDRLELVRRHFELRGAAGRFVCSPPDHLPLHDDSVDVVCLDGSMESAPPVESVAAEAFRVLRPGGKVLALMPARFDATFWQAWFFPWRAVLGRPAHADAADRFSARRLRRTFSQFAEHRVKKRQLRRAELPHLWRW